ncbi:hypothetical protein Hanom_Chr12g01130941 [Helianthus anomalus]
MVQVAHVTARLKFCSLMLGPGHTNILIEQIVCSSNYPFRLLFPRRYSFISIVMFVFAVQEIQFHTIRFMTRVKYTRDIY